jgi:rare lipoprotein A
MKNYIMAFALVNGFTSTALADELGIASYYQYFHNKGLTAAHRTLPLGSQVRVTNLANGRTAVVKIIDRGPFIRGRIIDVSTTAASVLGFKRAGVTRVRIEKL